MQELPFKFEMPIEAFWKAGEKGKERRIGGIVSTEEKDRQGEVVLQRGLDFNEFLKNGWFNDNHSKDTAGIIGYPEIVSSTVHKGKAAHKVEGYLLEDFEPADRIWKLAQSLQRTGRRLGFSIEGSVIRRDGLDGKTIAKARVRNVAITNCPVNTSTGLDIVAKSMMALEAAEDRVHQCWDQDQCCGGSCQVEKTLAAGAAVAAPPVRPGEGFPLRVESAEEELKDPKKKRRKLTKAEAVAMIRTRWPKLSKAQAEHFLTVAAKL